VTPGLSERILKEVMATPALKELVILQMKDIKPDTAPGVVKMLLWGDPGISMSLFGALPEAVNWLLELLLELGRQLNGLPEPLLKDILGQVGGGIDGERLKQFPEIYGQLIRRILIGEGKTPEETRAAVTSALNAALAGLDALTVKLEDNRADGYRPLPLRGGESVGYGRPDQVPAAHRPARSGGGAAAEGGGRRQGTQGRGGGGRRHHRPGRPAHGGQTGAELNGEMQGGLMKVARAVRGAHRSP